MDIDNIYVIHFNKLTDRKKYLVEHLSKFNIRYEFIESSPETDEALKADINKYYLYNPKILPQVMPIGVIGTSLAHINVYKDILKRGYRTCLVLEDDAIFPDNIQEILFLVLKEMGPFDFAFLSTCCNLNVPKKSDKLLYEVETSRSVCGYLVKNKKLQELIDISIPFSLPIDWHLNFVKNIIGFKYAWSQPAIIIQGSETVYKSNLR